jgi:N-methylhydantoinase B
VLEIACGRKRLGGESVPFGASAIYDLVATAGAGYGDPILREPAAVADDIRKRRVSADDAARIYGVMATETFEVDEPATIEARAGLIANRLASGRPPREECPGSSTGESHQRKVLAGVRITDEGRYLSCAHCGQHLSTGTGNYRLGCRELDSSLPSLSPVFDDPEEEVGEPIIARSYLCPSCGIALDCQVCKPADVPFQDVRLLSVN